MTKLRLLALLAVVALVLFPAIAFAQGELLPPSLPCAFQGTVQLNGQDVVDGTIITATIGNETYTTTTIDSSYIVVIAQPEGKNYDGLIVTFMIGNATVTMEDAWEAGGQVQLNLAKGVAPSQGGGGGITDVVVNALPAGSAPTRSYDPETGILTLGIPAGAQGIPGNPGGPGIQGTAGKDANNILGIVGIVLAVIAIALAVIVMVRKQQAAPPAPKT